MKYQVFFLCLFSSFFARADEIQRTQSKTNNFPSYFIGKFEDTVPDRVGGSIPNLTWSLNCDRFGSCNMKVGESDGEIYKIFPLESGLQYAKYALQYAKDHSSVGENSSLAWQANHLKPLLSSKSEIESCVELKNESVSDGYMLLCKLDHDPWGKKTVLLFGTLMSLCSELFCRYETFPFFRK